MRVGADADGVVDIDHVVLRVADLDRSARFYATVLGAERVDLNWERVGLRFGGGRQINLHGPESTPDPVPVRVPPPGSGDICFEWSGPAETAAAHLRTHGITPEAGPVPRTGARGPATSVYFRDPDGNLLELLAY